MTKTVNKDRGYVLIELGDKTYEGRVNLNSIKKMEDGLGQSMLAMGVKLSMSASMGYADIRVDDMITILMAVINEVEEVDETELSEQFLAAGLAQGPNALAPILDVMFQPASTSDNETNEEDEGNA